MEKEKYINYPTTGHYRHYKGGLYKVISLAEHTETKEKLVIYQSVSFGSIYARPLSQWFEEVPYLNGDSQTMTARFRPTNET